MTIPDGNRPYTVINHPRATLLGLTIEKDEELVQASSGAYYMRTNFYIVDPKVKTAIKFRDLKSINAYLTQLDPGAPKKK